MTTFWWVMGGCGLFIVIIVIYDLIQTKHAILRNFPIIGHLRYILEAIGPELRQYIVTNNDEERPFSRDQRRWVYASSKKQNNYFGFGTDNDLEISPNYLILKHQTLPPPDLPSPNSNYDIPCAKILGNHRKRDKAFRPTSIINLSGMSYGSLSSAAVSALSQGSEICNCLYHSGEGGIAPFMKTGAGIIWQIGTGYYGCRDENGAFSLDRFNEVVQETPQIKAIEIKLSQGGKPGLGGILPAAKITKEISQIRGIPQGKDCRSPAFHSAFSGLDGLLDFVELLAGETGLPVGIKACVGEEKSWDELARLMESGGRGVDFVAIDGGEGGTGAGPLAFTDHVGLPFKVGFPRVYKAFAKRGLHEKVVFIGSGKLGFPETALLSIAMGCDMVHIAREAMLAIGCIQAQRCHTGHCPTGVATQNSWLVRGLSPGHKAARFANYVTILRKEMLQLTHACGESHPSLISSDHFEILDEFYKGHTPTELFGYEPSWGVPSEPDRQEIKKIMVSLSHNPM